MGRRKDFKRLYKFVVKSKCKFIMEVGSGLSTKYLCKAAKKNGARLVTIDMEEKGRLKKEDVRKIGGIEYYAGLSIDINDIFKVDDLLFIEHPEWEKNEKFRKTDICGRIAHGEKVEIECETNLIRKILDNSTNSLDFFFCDTGEYCGLSEWNIVKNRIKIGVFLLLMISIILKV